MNDTQQERIHALVSKWADSTRIPVSFDDWDAQVVEDGDLEGWVEFNIREYLHYTISDECERDHGWTFTDEERATIESIIKETNEIMGVIHHE